MSGTGPGPLNTATRSILITGAGSGIGHDAAFALAALGHRVHATTADDAQAEALRAEALDRRLPMTVFKLDITRADERALVAPLELDVLINNAGVGESGSLADVPIERVRRCFEVNVFGTLELTQLVLRGMIARRRGTVLFVSSIAGRIPVPFLMPYSMSKFALSAAGAGLRAEMDQLGAGIQVALIEPGAFHTGFNQAMTARKYEWMAAGSYFSGQAARLRTAETRRFGWLESRSTRPIVNQIVRAALAHRPRLRYTAPWIQGAGVRLARIFGV